MCSLQSILRAEANEELTFREFDTKFIEIWHSKSNGSHIREENLPLRDLSAWLNQEGIYQPPDPQLYTCCLRLLYQEWPDDLSLASQGVMPFTKDAFDRITSVFQLPLEYSYIFLKNIYTPCQIKFKDQEKGYISIISQTPRNDSFSSMALSYSPITSVTCGILGYNTGKENKSLIPLLRNVAMDAAHPFLLPMLLLKIWMSRFYEENYIGHASLIGVLRMPVLAADPESSAKTNKFTELGKVHRLIVKTHDDLNNSIVTFLQEFSINLQSAFDRLGRALSQDQQSLQISPGWFTDVPEARVQELRQLQRGLEAVLSEWNETRKGMSDLRASLLIRLNTQLQVLYNFMQRHDSEKTQEIADDSKRIAAASKLDSSAMKTIATVTMIFLPGTAIATILSMATFFNQGQGGTILVSSHLWIYFVIAIPVTVVVFGAWWLWTTREQRKQHKVLEKEV